MRHFDEEDIKIEHFTCAQGGTIRITHLPTGLCVLCNTDRGPVVRLRDELLSKLARKVTEYAERKTCGMVPNYIVYDDGEITVGLFAKDTEADQKHLLLSLGMRWLPPKTLKGKDGQLVEFTNIMGGETQWFLLPYSFGVSVGRTLIEQKVADCGLAEFFNESGFKRMVSWLVEMEEISGAMCY